MRLEARNINYGYQNASISKTALKNVSLGVAEGERIALLGAPGSGKSTLLLVLAGLIQPRSGEVLYNGHLVGKNADRRWLRRNVGISLQQPEEQFFAATVWDEVEFAPTNLGVDKKAARVLAVNALCTLNLDPEKYGPRSPFALSGGERRRVALACALTMQPGLLLLDEPLAGLDYNLGREVWKYINNTIAASGTTCIVATHDTEWALEWANRALVMVNGEISHNFSRKDLQSEYAPNTRAPLGVLDNLVQHLHATGFPVALAPYTPASLADAIAAVLHGERNG